LGTIQSGEPTKVEPNPAGVNVRHKVVQLRLCQVPVLVDPRHKINTADAHVRHALQPDGGAGSEPGNLVVKLVQVRLVVIGENRLLDLVEVLGNMQGFRIKVTCL
jgi:hypothetical protein